MTATEVAGEIRGTASQLLTPQLMMFRQSLPSQHLDLMGNTMKNLLKTGCYSACMEGQIQFPNESIF